MSQKIKIVFLTIITLIIINCGTVFASGASEGFEYFVENDSRFTSFKQTDYYPTAMNVLYNYENIVIYVKKQDTTDWLNVYVTNNKFYEENGKYYVDGPYRRLEIWLTSDTKVWRYQNTGSNSDAGFGKPEILYTNSGILKSDGSFAVPPTNTYKEPYFEFSANKIGKTTLENFDGNIPCFYPTSFKSNSNSYASFKEIGKLYIDENYEISQLYTSVPDINIYNLTQTQSWTYKNYLIFTDNIIVNGYRVYTINIDLNYIKTPYIYTMELKSLDNELASNISIDFVLLTQTTEGGIVVESGDTEVSGDLTKDETTLGDIQNTIENIFQEPNEEELKQEQENNINEIKNQITNDLENNKVFSALTTAEQGLIELLEGEPRGF